MLVCFPFKEEDIEVLSKNISNAASHSRVIEVLCIGKEKNSCYKKIEEIAPKIEKETKKKVNVITQKRLGRKRSGKGDGVNTGLKYFLEETTYKRIHFYDSDILSFNKDWITKAEIKADEGFRFVKHYFPRPSTDGMITWHITKPGFAILWPGTGLVDVEQPLGGELLMTTEAAQKLFDDVLRYSDWSIETAFTWFTFWHKIPICEVYLDVGKLHKFYKTLMDLKLMLVECFSIIQELKDKPLDTHGIKHEIEKPGRVPNAVKNKIAYEVEKTLFLKMNWTGKQIEYLEYFPNDVKEGMIGSRGYPRFIFMNENSWYEVYKILLDEFNEKEEDWRELLFKLWVSRVLNYTVYESFRGYDHAISYLYEMVKRYEKMAMNTSKKQK